MTDLKTYLNVPYEQKDAAKALGAKWDALNKKWYVEANKDLAPFAKWQSGVATLQVQNKPTPRVLSSKSSPSANNGAAGAVTYPAAKDFVAYKGEEPPWD